MRIWSKRLICYLPDKQLKAMRYELGDMIKQYPNIKHSLVKFANEYDIGYLGNYFLSTVVEIDERNINTTVSYDSKIIDIVAQNTQFDDKLYDADLRFEEDNDRYLKQCYYNLQEKYDRGIVSEEEWRKIDEGIRVITNNKGI